VKTFQVIIAMPHSMAILQGVIETDGWLMCDSEPLRCSHCGVIYYLHFSSDMGSNQLRLCRFIAGENINNEHPRHRASMTLGSPHHC
jgi:hypothetical protein